MELQAELVAGEQKLQEVLQEREARRCAKTFEKIFDSFSIRRLFISFDVSFLICGDRQRL